jgi:hypothetical protein
VAGTVLEDGRPVNESSKYRTALEKKVCAVVMCLAALTPYLTWFCCCQVKVMTEMEFLEFVRNAKPKVSRQDSSVPNAQPSKVSAAAVPVKPVSSTVSGMRASSSSSAKVHVDTDEHSLWVDKYKPQSIDQLIGSADIAKKVLEWLRRWDEVHLKKSFKIPHSQVSM